MNSVCARGAKFEAECAPGRKTEGGTDAPPSSTTIRLQLDTDLIPLSLLATDALGGLRVAGDLFLGGVPGDLAIEADADVRQVTGGHRSVVREHVRDRLLAALHAEEEVLHVVPVGLPLEHLRDGPFG